MDVLDFRLPVPELSDRPFQRRDLGSMLRFFKNIFDGEKLAKILKILVPYNIYFKFDKFDSSATYKFDNMLVWQLGF
jgi:hypothetical protein